MTLTRQYQLRRLRWARQFQRWQHRNWQRVLFSSESRFRLFRADGRTRIYRRAGERTVLAVFRRLPFGGGSVRFAAVSVVNCGHTLLSLTEILSHTVTCTWWTYTLLKRVVCGQIYTPYEWSYSAVVN